MLKLQSLELGVGTAVSQQYILFGRYQRGYLRGTDMNIRILAVGKLKESFYQEGLHDLIQKMNPDWSIAIYEIEEEPVPDRPSEKDILRVKRKESERIRAAISSGEAVITMEIAGCKMTEQMLAKEIYEMSHNGQRLINIVIGGSYGLDDTLQKFKGLSISLSEMTFPHQLVRLMVVDLLARISHIPNK